MTASIGGRSGLLYFVLAVQALVNAASFISIPLLALYLLKDLGYSAYVMGAVLTTLLVFTRLSPLFTGALADRWGYKRFVLAGLFVRCIGFALVSVYSETMIFVGVALIGLGGSLYESGTYGYLAYVNKVRCDVFYLNNQALNLGVIAGPILAFFVPRDGYGMFFIASAFAFLGLAIVSIFVFPGDDQVGRSSLRPSFKDLAADFYKDKTFLVFNIISIPWWFLFSQLYVLLPLAFSKKIASGGNELIIYVINGIVGISLTLLLLRRMSFASPLKLMIVGHSILACAYLIPLINNSASIFLLMVVVFSIGETLIMPAMDSFVAKIAPVGREANYFGIANIPWIVGASAGNMVGGKLFEAVDGMTPWIFMSALAVSGTLMSLFFLAWLKANQAVDVAGRRLA